MTNEVEKLILEKTKTNSELINSQKNAYLFYKEIWNFILYVYKYNFITLKIRFDVNKRGTSSIINKEKGIKYEISGLGCNDTWETFYQGCNHYNIIKILNEDIDFHLLFRLLHEDGFFHSYLDDDKMLVYIEISKREIINIINNVHIKNKILEKVVDKNDRIS